MEACGNSVGKPFMVPWTTQVSGVCEVLAQGGGELWRWLAKPHTRPHRWTHAHTGAETVVDCSGCLQILVSSFSWL